MPILMKSSAGQSHKPARLLVVGAMGLGMIATGCSASESGEGEGTENTLGGSAASPNSSGDSNSTASRAAGRVPGSGTNSPAGAAGSVGDDVADDSLSGSPEASPSAAQNGTMLPPGSPDSPSVTSGGGTSSAAPAGGAGSDLSAGGAGGEDSTPPPPSTGGSTGTPPAEPPAADGICPTQPGVAPSGTLTQAELVWEVEETDYDFHLYEGPAWTEGTLFFSDINPSAMNADGSRSWNSTIYRFDPQAGAATLFLAEAGSNGLAVDEAGVLYSATAAKQEISRYTLSPIAQERVVGGMLNSPNDIAVAPDGTIYFSDPQQGELPAGGQPQVVHSVRDGVDAIFTEDIQSPNGVLVSSSGDALYVTGGGSFVARVPIVDGQAGEIQTLVSDLNTPDGLTKDCLGNLYIAEHNAVQVTVFSPEGAPLANIPLGSARDQDARPTNVAFGGTDRKTLFITATYSLWKVELDVAGYPN